MRYAPLFGLLLSLSTCSRSSEPILTTPAFFYWQTQLRLTSDQQTYLQQLGVHTLYVRFFDVDWDDQRQDAVPLAETRIDTQGLAGMTIVPCVFITNQTLLQLPANQIPRLAERLLQKIETLRQQAPLLTVSKVLIDCDWTTRTRASFFSLTKHLQKSLHAQNKQLEVTIRLHQFRHPDITGVPPADHAMLMCYNTGDLEAWETNNSIYQEQDVQAYLPRKTNYPLPLHLALPAFHWGIVFRNNQLVRLIHGLEATQLSDTRRFRPISPNRFAVKKSTYLDGYYLYQGDRIRLESTGVAEMESALRLLKPFLPKTDSRTVAVFHLDTTLVQKISYVSMASIFSQTDR